jgi:hypothetical protein
MTTRSREVLVDGSVRFSSDKCSIWISRLRPGLVLVDILGHDTGGFAPGPLDELQSEIARYGTIEVFIDTRNTFNATPAVAEEWTQWISRNSRAIQRLHVLVESKYVQMTVEVGKLFSRTGELMRIYTHAPAFAEALQLAYGGAFDLDEHVAPHRAPA